MNSHDAIRDRVHHRLWSECHDHYHDGSKGRDGYVVEKERSILDGRRRVDVAVSTPGRDFAFEVKTSVDDLRNFPAQARDYCRAGMVPVPVVPMVLSDRVDADFRLIEARRGIEMRGDIPPELDFMAFYW